MESGPGMATGTISDVCTSDSSCTTTVSSQQVVSFPPALSLALLVLEMNVVSDAPHQSAC